MNCDPFSRIKFFTKKNGSRLGNVAIILFLVILKNEKTQTKVINYSVNLYKLENNSIL